ncbi:MAG: DUF2889 domain-containing protein [Rhodospirillales bacterium]
MPLSKPVRRKLMHTRAIRCQGFEREDGLWDIEGHITDNKTYSFESKDREYVSAGDPVHDMWIRFTVDSEMVVVDAEAVTHSSPYAVCPKAAEGYKALIGAKIQAGWRREVVRRTGGVKGCTHINDMIMSTMAVTAYQTVIAANGQNPTAQPGQKPPLIDSCHAYRSDGEIAPREYPEYFKSLETGS